jgi:MFS family permease
VAPSRDRRIIYAATFLRATAISLCGVVLGIYPITLGLGAEAVGTIVTAGLSGAALATLIAMFYGDRFGRRAFLIGLSLLSAAGAVCAVFLGSTVLTLAACAFFGMLNGMGRDRGAALVLEQAILPSTTTDQERTRVFAYYNVFQDAGHVAGSLLAAVVLSNAFYIYAALLLACAVCYTQLSKSSEAASMDKVTVSAGSKRLLAKISALFLLDSLGGGLLTTALLSYFFFTRFDASEAAIAFLFAGARAMNAVSHLGASWLAKRIGLVRTMVFTHIPSSLLLATVAFAPSFPVAAILFLIREGLVEMDVPTRQSYVMAVVRPEERTVASAVTHLVRMGAWAVGPIFAGSLMSGVALATPLFAAAGMKITYDILLYRAFIGVAPPEEQLPGREKRA